MMAGTKWRGEFEERLKAVMDEVISTQDVIIFVDEVRFCLLTDRHVGVSSLKVTTSLGYYYREAVLAPTNEWALRWKAGWKKKKSPVRSRANK